MKTSQNKFPSHEDEDDKKEILNELCQPNVDSLAVAVVVVIAEKNTELLSSSRLIKWKKLELAKTRGQQFVEKWIGKEWIKLLNGFYCKYD